MKLMRNSKGNYVFLTGIAPYSSGVAAMPGYEIVHVTLRKPLPYRQGFELIEQHLQAQGRPNNALCAIQLRSSRPFSFEGFSEFNQGYQRLLQDWGLLVEGHNPVARTNVAPEVQPPAEPVLYAFSMTVPAGTDDHSKTFVIAGAGELSGGSLSPKAIVRAGETSPEAMQAKVAHVMGIMQSRLSGLQMTWNDVTTVDIYTVHALQHLLADEILNPMGATAVHGVHWYYSRPPITGLEYEMDMRGIRREIRI
jgi:hypothetical protein